MKQNKVKRAGQSIPFQVFVYLWVTAAVIFSFIPLYLTFINSFKNPNEVAFDIWSFPGKGMFSTLMENYSSAWKRVSPYFFKTILVALVGAFGVCLLGSILSYILVFKDFYFKNAIFMLFMAVLLVPSIIGYPTLIPLIRDTFHLGDTYFGYVLPTIGGAQVGAMFLFRTFFQQQPKALYESARIDGANDVEIFFKITVPLSLPILLYYALIIFTNIYNDFLWASLILDKNLTMMPAIFSLVDSGAVQYGEMYALYMISSVPLIITTAISMKYFVSGEFASGMKL